MTAADAVPLPARFRAGTATPAPPVVPGVEWVRPRPDARGVRNDAILAALILVGSLTTVALSRVVGVWEDPGPWWASLVWAVGTTSPLAWRRRQPELVAILVCVGYALGLGLQIAELVFSQITLFMVLYVVGAWSGSRLRAGVVRGVLVGGMLAWLFANLLTYSAAGDYGLSRESVDGPLSPYVAYGLIQIITNLLFFAGAWYFGDSAYRAARQRAALEQRTAELAAERERSRDQAVRLERVRIARELHDSVAHHVSVMGVQAGAARRVLDRDPAAAAAALSTIETSARRAVDELQRLLGTLRDAGDAAEDPAVASASTLNLARVGALVEEARASGLRADFIEVGERRPVPPSVDVAGYRVAQEALTNVRKHAGPSARADVRVRWEAHAVEVEVTNTGTLAPRPAPGGAGLGLIGMRERVDALGGGLELGPRSRGGFLVRARLPLPAVPGDEEAGNRAAGRAGGEHAAAEAGA